MDALDTVLIDLDDTLIEYERTTEELLDRTYEELDVEPAFSASDYYSRYDDFLDESTDVRDHRERCFVAAAEANGHDATLGREIAEKYTRFRENTGVQYVTGAVDALDYIATDYSVGLVTNGSPAAQQAKIDAVSLGEWIDTVVFAGYDTPAKPSPEAFQRALSVLDSSPDRALVIGDSLSSDIAGANAADITSIWVPSYEQSMDRVEPDYTIESLDELHTII